MDFCNKSRKRLPVDLVANKLLDAFQFLPVHFVYKCDCHTCSFCTSCAAHTVNIIIGIRRIKINYKIDIFYIYSPARTSVATSTLSCAI